MCLQCVVESKRVFEEDLVPGFALHISTKHDDEWPLGWYGLVVINDPDLVFPSDLDSEEMCDYFYLDPCRGHRLVEACKKVGYDPDKDGWWIYEWIIERIREKLNGKVSNSTNNETNGSAS